MNSSNQEINLIISCNRKGIAEKIYLDSDHFFENITLPVGLHTLVHPDSMEALGELWMHVIDHTMVENILVTLQSENRSMVMSFSGYLLKDKILLCGNNKESSTEKVLSEMLEINNEQLNQIRSSQKELFKLKQDKKNWDMNESILNDFSQLNNDLTNQQRQLAQQNVKIMKLNKKMEIANENMNMFAYSVSHDLKEPVRMIHSFMGLIQKKYADQLDEKGKKFVDLAVDGSLKLNQMINDLLVYYRSTAPQVDELVDLNLVVEEIKLLLKRQIEEKKARIIASELPVITGSLTGWRQLMQNLVSNAIKFVPPGRTPEIRITAENLGQEWKISVADNGTGIDPDMQESVFKLFKRAHSENEYEGTGIGLAIVKRIVQSFDGDISIESEMDKGSTFVIRFDASYVESVA